MVPNRIYKNISLKSSYFGLVDIFVLRIFIFNINLQKDPQFIIVTVKCVPGTNQYFEMVVTFLTHGKTGFLMGLELPYEIL